MENSTLKNIIFNLVFIFFGAAFFGYFYHVTEVEKLEKRVSSYKDSLDVALKVVEDIECHYDGLFVDGYGILHKQANCKKTDKYKVEYSVMKYVSIQDINLNSSYYCTICFSSAEILNLCTPEETEEDIQTIFN